MLYFLILFLIKEIYMVVMGLLLIRRKKVVMGAQSYGKLSTAINDIGCFILLLFPHFSYFIGTLLIAVMMIVMAISWIKYIRFHVLLWKGEKKDED